MEAMRLREGGVFVVFPEIPEGVLNSWESATGDREREVKLSGVKPPKLCFGSGERAGF